MFRRTIAMLLVGMSVGVGVICVLRQPALSAPKDTEPDPTQSKPLDHTPDDEDLARLRSVEGKPKEQVIQVLGHPRKVERQADGTEAWDYDWSAGCRVWIRNDVCTGTYYDGGY